MRSNSPNRSDMTINSPEFIPDTNPRLSPTNSQTTLLTASSMSSSDGMSISSGYHEQVFYASPQLNRSSSDGLLPRNNFHVHNQPVENYPPEALRVCHKVNFILTKFCKRGRLEDFDSKLLREMMLEVIICNQFMK